MKLQLVIHEILYISEVMRLSKEFEFFIYLLQKYAAYKQIPANKVLELWNLSKVFENERLADFIQDMYWVYHTERIENAFIDIDYILEHGVPLEEIGEL